MADERDLLELPFQDDEPEPFPDEPQEQTWGGPPSPKRPSWAKQFFFVFLLVAVGVGGYFMPRAGPPVLRSQRDLIDFSEQRVGVQGAETTLDLRNGGERPLLVLRIGVEGDAAGEVELLSDDCTGVEIAPSSECPLLLAFSPSEVGDRTATLIVEGEAPNSPLRVPIVGSGIQPELSAEPTRRSFPTLILGDVSATEIVRLRNNGTAPLVIERADVEGGSASEFEKRSDNCSGEALEPDSICSIGLAFAPAAIGERTASLKLYSDSPGEAAVVELRGAAVEPQPLVRSNRQEIDFNEQLVSTRSDEIPIALSNGGTGGLDIREIQLVDNDGAFSVSAGDCGTRELRGTAQCELRVSFAPQREGRHEGRVVVASSTREPPTSISLEGVGIQPRLEISTAELAFGEVPLGDSAEQVVRLRNAGSAPLALGDMSLGRRIGRDFSLGDDGCGGRALGPGESCSITVAFHAGEEGLRRGELVIEHDASDEATRLPLTAAGTIGRLQLSPAALDFGDVPVGSIERQRLSLSNPGSARVTVLDVEIETVAAQDFAIVVNGCTNAPDLDPGGLCSIVFEFSPSAAGDRRIELRVLHDGAGGPLNVTVSGRGAYPEFPPIQTAPRQVAFGSLELDRRSDIETFEIRNTGAGPVEIGAIRIVGTDAEQFEIVPASCDGITGLDADVDADCTVGVRFHPRRAGELSAVLAIENGGSREPIEIPLSGTALEPTAPVPPPSPPGSD